MKETIFEQVASAASVLKLDLSAEEFALFAEDREFSEAGMEAVQMLLGYLSEKKQQTTIQTLLKMSRLPTKAPKTFENFDFSLLKGKDVERLKVLSSLNAIYSHRNLAFIGPAGTGKTHLAQAFGYACCQHGLKTYFIKASELRDRFTAARRSGKTDSCLNGLVRPSCLIIDEIGHCAFDKENTRLFFDLIDRRYNKEGSFNMIFTSNKNPALWREDFEEDATLTLLSGRRTSARTMLSCAPWTASLTMPLYLSCMVKVSAERNWKPSHCKLAGYLQLSRQ